MSGRTGDVAPHGRAAWGPSIRTMQGLINSTFIKIDQIIGVSVSQLVLELCAGDFVPLNIQERFFFG